MVSVKSTRILVFVYNVGLNNGRMYRIQQYTVRHRHQGYGETEDTRNLTSQTKKVFYFTGRMESEGLQTPYAEFCNNSIHPAYCTRYFQM